MGGYVVAERAVDEHIADGDTAAVKVAIDASCGCERLEQRVIRFGPGRSADRTLEDRQEVLYVASGNGTLFVDGRPHELEPETGVFLAPGETWSVENSGPEPLLVVSVGAAEENGANGTRRVTVRYADQPSLPASPNREFRYLINQEAGCRDMTQFVGTIPPGRAPMHSHTYDEVVYVIEGQGVLHKEDGTDVPISEGTCIHLPPLGLHSLENTGPTPMRVLGVFHPSGDPASKAKVANE
jgi:mannose-6-phosphate isomerase-like protein (cupin superfamily)